METTQPAPPAGSALAQPLRIEREDQPRARILIVDDDERNAFAACQALEPLDQELVVASSGEEALRRLLTEEFAVILLDLHMPGMDGYETAELIRSRRRTRSVPIVFLTAVFRDEAHLFKAYSAGAVDVVFKPVDPFMLRSKVAVLVELHLKTKEVERQAAQREALLEENARVHAEKLAAERALRKTEERQEAILKSLPIVFHSRATEVPFPALFVSDGVHALTGYGPERFVGEAEFGLGGVHPDDLDEVVKALGGAMQAGAYSCEYRWKCADGEYRSFLDQGVVAQGQDGETREIFGTLLDITDRRSLEEQLTQARKMEAVGQLTGGVAHDFNNLLTVILGNLDLVMRKIELEDRAKRQLSAVRHAAERGQELTRQLLSFSRRQHLSPVAVDLNKLIADFTPLLQQAAGEAVRLKCPEATAPLRVNVDPAHLETALLNLTVNARDAMASGGELTITVDAVDAADLPTPEPEGSAGWARIDVTDTGAGMTRQVVDHIFEPFFTTKDVGKGSGLGLSQVYGFVHQSGGQIAVKSQPGAGTTFSLYLPATSAPVAKRMTCAPKNLQRGDESLLVVEDDPAVLALTVQMLEGLGYRIVTAMDGKEALQRLRGRRKIDLLFSDVVMPGGLTGVQLAEKAQELRPSLKVLLTSGYVGHHVATTQTRFPLIDKPYEQPDLAAKLRSVLDEDPPERPTPASAASGAGMSA